MSISSILALADQVETALAGKQPIAPIVAEVRSAIADMQLALGHLDKAMAGISAIVGEVQPTVSRPAHL